jgi:hypothetical protein
MICLEVGTLHQKLTMLVLKLWMRNLHQCKTQERGSNKLTGLQKARASVASRVLVQKTHLALSNLLHLFQLILDDNVLVNQLIKIWVVGVEQLKLDLILETIEKHILLLIIGADIIGGIP